MSFNKKRHADATNEHYDAWLADEFGAGNHFSAVLSGRLVGPYPMTGEMLALFRTDPTCECVTIYETGEIVWDRNMGLSGVYAKRRKTSRFGVWQWDDWTRDIPTLICDPIDDKGVYFAELVPAWPNDVNDRGEYEWDGSFDPEIDTTLWTIEIYDTEFGATGDWTEFVDCTAREAMEEADDFIAEFITEQNLIGNGPYTLARRNAMRKRRNKTAEITWGEAEEVLADCVDRAVSYFEEYVDDYDYVDDAVSDAIHDAYESALMYNTDQLAMIWACGALEQAMQNAWETIDEVVYDEFYKRIDPDDYRKEGRRKARRRKMRR